MKTAWFLKLANRYWHACFEGGWYLSKQGAIHFSTEALARRYAQKLNIPGEAVEEAE